MARLLIDCILNRVVNQLRYSRVLTGGTDTLTAGTTYRVLCGTINGHYLTDSTEGWFTATLSDVSAFTLSTQKVAALARVYIGGTDSLTLGATYWILSGTLNGKTNGKFVADSTDLSSFTSATQQVSGAPFGNRIYGAGSLPRGTDTTFEVPALYVVNISEEEHDSLIGTDTPTCEAVFKINIGLLAALDNTPDYFGQAGAEQVDDVRDWLNSRLQNWLESWMFRATRYKGNQFVQMDDSYYWRNFDYVILKNYDDADGYQTDGTDSFTLNMAYLDILPTPTTPVIYGDTGALLEGYTYWIEEGSASINGKTQSWFTASAADVAAFTLHTQTVRFVDCIARQTLTGV